MTNAPLGDSCTHILALLSHLKIATTIATIILSMCADPLLCDLVEPGNKMKVTPLQKWKIFCFQDEPVPVISAPFHICHRLWQQLELNHYDMLSPDLIFLLWANWILDASSQFSFSNVQISKLWRTNPGKHWQEREDSGFWDELSDLVDALVHCLDNGLSPLLYQVSWPCSSSSPLYQPAIWWPPKRSSPGTLVAGGEAFCHMWHSTARSAPAPSFVIAMKNFDGYDEVNNDD